MEGVCPWGGYARAADVGCEPDLCAWIVHPAETWSNLALFAVAAFLLVRYGREDRGLPVAWLPWIVVAIGVGSSAFHASMIHWLHVVDLVAIFLFMAFLLAAHLQRAGWVGAQRFSACFLVLASGGAALAFADFWLATLGITAQGVAILWLAWRSPTRGPRRELVAAIAFNQVAAVALWLDKGQLLCSRGALSHVVQPHSFWHVLSALSLLFVYRWERQIEHTRRGPVRTSACESGLLLLLLLLLLASGCGGADLVLRHGAVYTVDPGRSFAEAVAVDGGRIVYVGPDAGVEGFVGGGSEVIDLGGRMLLPGFHDSHAHVLEGGISLGLLDLSDLETREAILEAVHAWATAHPDEDWIVGFGWALPIFPDANPSKAELDAIVPDRPVYLGAADGHSAWVNSRALAEAGIAAATPDPPKGRIERDPATGEPGGTLRESAMELVSARAHDFGAWRAIQGLRAGVAHANRHGITSFVEARATPDHARVYRVLDLLGLLHARVTLSLAVDPERGEEQVAELRESFRSDGEHGFSANAAKIFVDGVIEARTAALVDPYLGGEGGAGIANFEPEALDRIVTALDAAGFQVHFHAIGDRGVRMALDAVAAARRANGPRDTRPQIAHVELVRPEDVPRFRELGVVADFQPLWAFPDPYVTELTLPVLGPERSRWIYPIGSLVRSGAVVAAGSDWPVSSIDPLDAIEVALTRESPDGSVAGVLLPEERVDLAAMLAAYTIQGAFVQHQEDFTGSIEVGKAADLVVLDRNLFAIPPEEISEARTLLTLLAGEEVWRDPDFLR